MTNHQILSALRCTLAIASVIVGSAVPAAGQTDTLSADTSRKFVAISHLPFPADSLRPGHRVRFTMSGRSYGRTGTLLLLRPDTLLLVGDRDGEVVRIPRNVLGSFDVSSGPQRTARALITGTLLGAAGGFVFERAVRFSNERSPRFCTDTPLEFECAHSLRFIIAGAGIGFGAVVIQGRERWRSVDVR